MKKNDLPYIKQMHQNIEKVHRFIKGHTFETFNTDEKTQSAVLLQFIQIGELAKRVSDKQKATVNIPWKEIMGFRNLIVHEYYDVLLPVVWNILEKDLEHTQKELSEYITEYSV